ncbi:MAG TPA: glycosyltransferase family 87 protein [Candidatus Dormibacteraeota bacterium]|nr:glycosyltransferase family 87 protein [Candidatus Dormibacteraeota bacterium]
MASIQASILLLLGEGLVAWPRRMAPESWTDFLAYYTASKMVLTGFGSHVYDRGMQIATIGMVTGIDPARINMPLNYLNPPQATILLTPLALIPYSPASVLWSVLMASTMMVAVGLLVRTSGWRGISAWATGLLVVAATPALFEVLRGQMDALVLLGFVACVVAVTHNRPMTAGFALSVVLLKPNVAFLVFPVLAMHRQWRVLAGAGLSALIQVVITSAIFGPQVWTSWVGLLIGPALGHENWGYIQATAYSVNSVLHGLGVPKSFDPWLIAGGSLITLGLVTMRLGGSRALSAALALSVVLSPHAGVQDLILLAPLAILYARDVSETRGLTLAVGAFLLTGLFLAAEFSPVWGWPIPIAVAVTVGHWMAGQDRRWAEVAPSQGAYAGRSAATLIGGVSR